MLMQMPGLGTSSFIGPAPEHFLLCKSPGAGHTFWCKSLGVPGGMVTSQIDTCITHDQDLSPSWRPDALYSEHNMVARPRPNMNSNNMKYTNTASPNRNNTNGHGKPRLSNGPKSPMNPSFSHTGHSGSRPHWAIPENIHTPPMDDTLEIL